MTSIIRRILVPTDFSASSDDALEYARGLAKKVGASIRLLHVLEEPLLTKDLVPEAYVTHAPTLQTALVQEARAQLIERAMGPDEWEVIFGHGAKAIVDHAAERDVDLIVMGTHGRTGIAHLVLGSVAEHVVRTASCPVLTVRQTAARERRPVAAESAAALAE